MACEVVYCSACGSVVESSWHPSCAHGSGAYCNTRYAACEACRATGGYASSGGRSAAGGGMVPKLLWLGFGPGMLWASCSGQTNWTAALIACVITFGGAKLIK